MTVVFLEEKCVLCGRDKWYHILPKKLRREQDPKDDGHPFQPREMLDGRQMRLPFNVAVKPQTASQPARRKNERTA